MGELNIERRMGRFLPFREYIHLENLGTYNRQYLLYVQGDKYNNAGLQGDLKAHSRHSAPKLEVTEDKMALWMLHILIA